MPLKVLVLGGH